MVSYKVEQEDLVGDRRSRECEVNSCGKEGRGHRQTANLKKKSGSRGQLRFALH